MRNIVYKTYTYKFSVTKDTDTLLASVANLRGAVNYFCEQIPDLKVAVTHANNNRSDYRVVLSFSDIDNYHGLYISNIGIAIRGEWMYHGLTIDNAYKNNSGWIYKIDSQSNALFYRQYADEYYTKGYALKCVSITIDDSIRIIRLSWLDTNGSETYITSFMSCPCVDYFTSKNMRACMYFKSNSSLARVSNGSYRSDLLTPTIIGGSDYPSRNLSVAAPVIVAGSNTNSNFYGYLVDSTFLYAGFTGNDRINYDFKSQVKISGKTFVQLFPNFLVCIT